MIEIPGTSLAYAILPLLGPVLLVAVLQLHASASLHFKETNPKRKKILDRLAFLTIPSAIFLWGFGIYLLTEHAPAVKEQIVEDAYGIEIESGWPDKQLEKNSPFLIIYTDGDETFKGEVTVEDRKATIYSITTGDPLPLASE